MQNIIRHYTKNRSAILLAALGIYVIYKLSYSLGEMYYYFTNQSQKTMATYNEVVNFKPTIQDLINQKKWQIEAIEKKLNLGLQTIEDLEVRGNFKTEKESELELLYLELSKLKS